MCVCVVFSEIFNTWFHFVFWNISWMLKSRWKIPLKCCPRAYSITSYWVSRLFQRINTFQAFSFVLCARRKGEGVKVRYRSFNNITFALCRSKNNFFPAKPFEYYQCWIFSPRHAFRDINFIINVDFQNVFFQYKFFEYSWKNFASEKLNLINEIWYFIFGKNHSDVFVKYKRGFWSITTLIYFHPNSEIANAKTILYLYKITEYYRTFSLYKCEFSRKFTDSIFKIS